MSDHTPLDDAMVEAILAREQLAAGQPAAPNLETLVKVDDRMAATVIAVLGHYREVEEVMEKFDCGEVAADHLDVVVKFYPGSGLWIMEKNGTTRWPYQQVPMGRLARGLPALTEVWRRAKSQVVTRGIEMERALAVFRSKGGIT